MYQNIKSKQKVHGILISNFELKDYNKLINYSNHHNHHLLMLLYK
jgi:hypothetical protein